jgi:hypothetical protein
MTEKDLRAFHHRDTEAQRKAKTTEKPKTTHGFLCVSVVKKFN